MDSRTKKGRVPEPQPTTTSAGGPPTHSSSRPSPWVDALGRASIRAVQILTLVVLVGAAIYGLVQIQLVVLALLIALILASAVRPAVAFLERHGWSSGLAAGVVFLASILTVFGIITGVVMGIQQGWQQLADATVSGWQQLQDYVHNGPLPIPVDAASVNDALSQLGSALTTPAAEQSALTGLSTASEIIAGAVLMVVVLFFFLKDGPRMWEFVLRPFQDPFHAKLVEAGQRTVRILGSYTRGVALIATIDAVLVGLGLLVLGVPLAVPLTAIVFITAFIPIVGAPIAGILCALVALVTNGPWSALVVVGIVLIVHYLEGYFLHPVVMGRTLHLHSLVILIALSAGTILGGIAGAVLAVPLTAVAWAVLRVWAPAAKPTPSATTPSEDPPDRVENSAATGPTSVGT